MRYLKFVETSIFINRSTALESGKTVLIYHYYHEKDIFDIENNKWLFMNVMGGITHRFFNRYMVDFK